MGDDRCSFSTLFLSVSCLAVFKLPNFIDLKIRKLFKQETQDAHSKAVTSFKQREDGLSKARDLRDYNVTVEASKRRKEFDRRTRAIEEAVNRVRIFVGLIIIFHSSFWFA